ncbi:MAG TPA: hypothetical protein VFO91_07365 [Anaerolineales bacterium]|nr:hypothetical protein [Anaerolineales bacterium]
MGKKLYPSNVLKQAVQTRVAWQRIGEDVTFGSLKLEGLAAVIEGMYQMQHNVAKLEKQLIEMRHRRDDLFLSAWDQVKRVRAGVRGIYGDDSTEYELTGCTPRSKRKRARRVRVVEVEEMTREAE